MGNMPRRFSSWSGGAEYNSEQTRRSSIAGLSHVDYQPDPISGLPLEIFYAVLDEVGERHQRSSVLRSLSCASKTLHQYVQHRLWQTFNISDSPNFPLYPCLSVSESRRQCLTDSCDAITRALSRATYVWQLTITINSGSLQGFDSFTAINRIMQALLALPSLRVLTVHILSATRETAKALASMMRKAHFSFNLDVFTCPVSMEPEIFTFLAQQSSIEQYAVTLDSSSPSQKHVVAIDRSFRAISTSFLPKLRQYSGHTIYSQSLMWRRTFHYVSLFIHWRFLMPDVQAASRLELLVADRPHLAHVSALTLEIDDLFPVCYTAELGKLAAGIYGISPRFVERLRITRSSGHFSFFDFPPLGTGSLSQFTQLKLLEVVWKDQGRTSEALLKIECYSSASRSFIEAASGACITLRSVIVSIGSGFLMFERVDGYSAHTPLASSDEDARSLFVSPDSTWLMSFSVELPGWNDSLYPLSAPH